MLPQYSGGLGILAGDHLKTASDLGVPIIGVGLLYRHGYFRQSLSRDGWQQETYPVLDPDGLPLSLLREADGTVAKIDIGLPGGESLTARVWIAQVGRVPLLLLDSDVEENSEVVRDTTDRLYGGNTEHRLRQEMLLGIGGVRAIRAFTRLTGAVAPEVFHTNEGHAGFLGLERIRELTEDADGKGALSFEAALEVSRAGTVFTTHTPVPAGIDRFPRDLVEQYFGGDNACRGVPVDRILALGSEDYDGGDPAMFNMAVMGFRLAQRANGVSQLHGVVSRGMFGGLWPQFDAEDRPITSITNGVHAPTWVAREIFELARQHGARPGPGPGADHPHLVFDVVDKVPGKEIWDTKRVLRQRLVDDARSRLRKSWTQRGAAQAEMTWIDSALDADVLTIGFARRVPSYKRLTLMLRDPAAPQAAAAAPGAPGPAGDRRQVAPRRRGRQEADPGHGPLRRRPRGPAPHRVPAQLRHRDGAAALSGLRRLAEQPAASLRGVRHVRHEGGAQRRPQPVDPRRLVGRVVRREQRLVDPLGRRCRRPGPARRHRGRRALRPDRERGRTAVLRRGRHRRLRWCAGAVDRDGPPHDEVARAPRCSPTAWCATTCSGSTARRQRARGR